MPFGRDTHVVQSKCIRTPPVIPQEGEIWGPISQFAMVMPIAKLLWPLLLLLSSLLLLWPPVSYAGHWPFCFTAVILIFFCCLISEVTRLIAITLGIATHLVIISAAVNICSMILVFDPLPLVIDLMLLIRQCEGLLGLKIPVRTAAKLETGAGGRKDCLHLAEDRKR